MRLELSNTYSNLKNLYEHVNQMKSSIAETKEELLLTSQAKIVLDKLKLYKIEQKKKEFLDIINESLQAVFDYDLKLDIEHKETASGNLKFEIVLYEGGREISRNEKLLETNGGGVLSVISIIAKIILSYMETENKLFLFDESLSQVSVEYQPKLSMLLKNICSEYDFTILLISHTNEITEFADIMYILDYDYDPKKKTKTLRISKKLEDSSLKKDSTKYEMNIKNFQSIKSLKLGFQGFTVIRGRNNIGKSAIFRAIRACLTGHVRSDWLRYGTKQATLKLVKNNSDWIKVSFGKNSKVEYEFSNGVKLYGAKSAEEEFKRNIEMLGFSKPSNREVKDSSIKKLIKESNITNQHEGLFLIGERSSFVDKVLNVLFPVDYINDGISEAVTEIKELKNKIKNCVSMLDESKEQLSNLKSLMDEEIEKFKEELVEKVRILKETKQKLANLKNIYNKLVESIQKLDVLYKKQTCYSRIEELTKLKNRKIQLKNSYSTIFNNLVRIETYNNIVSNLKKKTAIESQLETMKQKYDYIKRVGEKCKEILEKRTVFSRLTHLLGNKSQFEKDMVILKKAVDKITDVTNLYKKVKYFDELRKLLIRKKELNDNLISTKKEYESLISKFKVCPRCGGTGYIYE